MGVQKVIKPSCLYIDNFRNFKNVELELGRSITIISGPNGVGKSNILSLIASGSGISRKSVLGCNFQPEFSDYFNIDSSECYEEYKLFLTYSEDNGTEAITKRLSFKNDTRNNRGIRIIPRTSNKNNSSLTIKQAEEQGKSVYDVGGAARVKIPTIYLSTSRLYPMGEIKESVKITGINKGAEFYQKHVDDKYKQWYNYVIPNSIRNQASLSRVDKKVSSRPYLHMDIDNTPILSQSVGQDNLGNIISALVDVYLLSLEDNYKGALICIDEVAVSLHPDAQVRLLDLLEQISKDLNIQFVLTTHSLTILKESLKKEKSNSTAFKVIYLKEPSAPYVTDQKNYELLKADMFGSLSYKKPKVKVYFEDTIGKIVFELLINAFRSIYNKMESNVSKHVLSNSSEVYDYQSINNRIQSSKQIINLLDAVDLTITELGCEELIKISKADGYFKRVIFVLDGDARYKDTLQKPRIRDFLEEKYDPKKKRLNDRQHTTNICFLPDYFAPESYLYRIMYELYSNKMMHSAFWRGLDSNENTALYTSEKISRIFSDLNVEYNNDDLKKIFNEYGKSKVWNFIVGSNILTYYYSNYKNIIELLDFIENVEKAFNVTYPILISNRYI